MKTILKTGLILFVICALSAGLCGIVNSITAPKIAENIRQEQLKAYDAVASGLEIGEETAIEGVSGVKSQLPLTADGKTEGVILNLTGNGYGGEFSIIASYSLDGELLAAKMMGNGETPGLGKKSEQAWYMDMFVGTGSSKPMPAAKTDLPGDLAQAVSGASITFGGVSSTLRNGSEYVKSLGGAL